MTVIPGIDLGLQSQTSTQTSMQHKMTGWRGIIQPGSLRITSVVCLAMFVLALGDTSLLQAQQDTPYLSTAKPHELGMSASRLDAIAPLIEKAIEDGQTPGAVIMIGRQGKIAYQRSFGHRQVEPEPLPMTIDTVFDLASLTKPIATATSVMVLLERGQVRLRDPAADYLPGFEQNGKNKITLTQLLTHQGGLIPDNPISDYADGRDEAVQRLLALETVSEPGTKFSYTDVGFIALGEMVDAITGRSVAQFSHDEIFAPLGMKDTGYVPDESIRRRCAATEQRNGEWMVGEVHDPRAYAMDGVAGHAGLFSTAPDLAIYAQMMLNGGSYRDARVLSPKTIERMTQSYDVSRGTRGLGWDKLSPYSSNRGELMSESAFGHGGFTGTAIWIDPDNELFVIFLSTRLHPDGRGSINSLAGRIGTIAVGAIDATADGTVDGQAGARADNAADSSHGEAPASSQSDSTGQTLTGIDVLAASQFQPLRGLRVGLITNHTGVAKDGQSTVQLLHDSDQVELTALFSPEHGFKGALDVSNIEDSEDTGTGLRVYSLYGDTRRPTPEMLQNVDTIVFDIQDIGSRFYTYVSTMGEAMIAADEEDKSFIVLDRPNPIGGLEVSGPVLDDGRQSFVGFHTISIQHGMTTGEIALMLREELELDLDLSIVRCQNWDRSMKFDETGLTWVNPSPNMRCLTQAILYPGIGLLETTNLSVGRGTDTPFELFGAPWIDGQKLAGALNDRGIAGVRFVPIRFRPESSVFTNEDCEGVNVIITNRNRFDALRTGFEIAATLRSLYPEDWNVDRYDRLLGDKEVLEALKDGKTASEIIANYQAELADFKRRRANYLLYQ